MSSSGINWGSVYNTPIGQILQDLNPSTFMGLITQESNSQVTSYQNQQSTDNTQISAWTTLQSDANNILSDLTTLSSASTYNQLTTSSSNNVVATAVDQSAQQGSYSIYVNSLAQAEIDQGSSTSNLTVTNPNATLTLANGSLLQGQFSIALGTNPGVSVTIPTAGESLNALAAQINSTSGMPVTASVVQNSSGDWVLEVQANSTGQPITYSESSTTNTPLVDLGIISSSSSTTAANVYQAASSAQVSFGTSFNASASISSTSNTFTNLIPGMTVTALSTGTTTITVAPNVSAVANSVQQFVSDWNQWVADTQNLAEAGKVSVSGSGGSASYSYTPNTKQVLQSGLPMNAINAAQQIMGDATNGLTTSAYQSLADIGLTFTGTGKINLNSSTLTQALANDPTAVQTLFANLSSALGTSTGTSGSILTGPVAGFAHGSQSVASDAISTLNTQVAQDQSKVALLNQQISAQEQQAITQYAQWVNQVAKDSEQYSLLNSLYNQNSSSSSGG